MLDYSVHRELLKHALSKVEGNIEINRSLYYSCIRVKNSTPNLDPEILHTVNSTMVMLIRETVDLLDKQDSLIKAINSLPKPIEAVILEIIINE